MIVITDKIKEIRKNKGFSHEYMAHKLDLSQPAYSKIEKNETVLSVDRLFKIAEILETTISDILEIKPSTVYNQNNNDNGAFVGHYDIQNLYHDIIEKSRKVELLNESRLKDKDLVIEQLQKIIEKLSN